MVLTPGMDSTFDLRLKAYGTAAAVMVLDRITKWLVETNVSFLDTHKVIPGFFDLVRSENRGVAFGLFNDSTSEWRTLALVLLSVTAVIGVSTVLWRPERLDRLSCWGFALILGGAAGNVVDRILYGRVTDFLLFYFHDYQWPAFNVADSAIVIGSGLLAVGLLRPKPQAANVP
jgi:signal peptidase II